MSVLAGPGMQTPLGASDDAAATAERLQFTRGRAVPASLHQRWAVFATGAMIAGRLPLLNEELTV